jgi:hypothetical protein
MRQGLADYAKIGARVRLQEIQSELSAIHDLFPDLAPAPPNFLRTDAREPMRTTAITETLTSGGNGHASPKRGTDAWRQKLSAAARARWAKVPKSRRLEHAQTIKEGLAKKRAALAKQ